MKVKRIEFIINKIIKLFRNFTILLMKENSKIY